MFLHEDKTIFEEIVFTTSECLGIKITKKYMENFVI